MLPLPFLFSFNYLRSSALFTFGGLFLLSTAALGFHNKSLFWYGSLLEYGRLSFFNLGYILGIDSISLSFLLLSTLVLLLCSLVSWNLKYQIGFYNLLLLFSLWLLFNAFLSLDLFHFYIFFEALLIPMFLLIASWGSRSRKVSAAYQLFLYTLLGSLFILVVFLCIYFNRGSASFQGAWASPFFERRQWVFWILLFLGFSVKIPVVPLHLWLPEAHVEAPTTGSVILAGILLKLGTYAMLRFLVPGLGALDTDLLFFVLLLAVLGFLHGALVALNQIDVKKIIAYASVSHMNFLLLGLFSQNLLGVTGALAMMFGHGLTASALFLGIGVLYDRYRSRLIFYYSSLACFMPLFSLCYFFFILSNFAFPGTVNFLGEFLISAGVFNLSPGLLLLTAPGLIVTLLYSLLLYNRLFFGPLSSFFLRYYSDYTRLEFSVQGLLVLLVLALGLFPGWFLDYNFARLFQLNYSLL